MEVLLSNCVSRVMSELSVKIENINNDEILIWYSSKNPPNYQI